MPKVLVIDDEEGILEILKDGLHERGFSVATAHNGLQGLDALLREEPDAVLLDVMMPGLDGFEVCRKLKEDRSTSGIPIVFLTARASREDIDYGMAQGADGYWTKPFDLDEVAEKLRALISQGGRSLAPRNRQ